MADSANACPIAEDWRGETLLDERGQIRRSHHFEVANKHAGQITWKCIHCGYSPGGMLTIGPEGITPNEISGGYQRNAIKRVPRGNGSRPPY